MRLDPADPIWQIELPDVEARSSIDLPTFSKWGVALADRILVGGEVILTGVATDCGKIRQRRATDGEQDEHDWHQ